MGTDAEVILIALQKEREDLHNRILQVDRIINRLKGIAYNGNAEPVQDNSLQLIGEAEPEPAAKPVIFPTGSDIKIQVMRVFEIVGYAASLQQLQDEYTKVSGNSYKIRETVRALHNVGILKMIKYRNASRGFLWVKTEWISENKLLDKFKPIGFDLLHKPDNLIFV